MPEGVSALVTALDGLRGTDSGRCGLWARTDCAMRKACPRSCRRSRIRQRWFAGALRRPWASSGWRRPPPAIADAASGCPALIVGIAPDDEEPKTGEVEACRLAIVALVRLRQFDATARVVLDAQGEAVSQWWPVAFALQRSADAARRRPAGAARECERRLHAGVCAARAGRAEGSARGRSWRWPRRRSRRTTCGCAPKPFDRWAARGCATRRRAC